MFCSVVIIGIVYDLIYQQGVLAAKVNDTAGVYFVPAFTGLFAPHWRSDARGYFFTMEYLTTQFSSVIVGLTQYTTAAHIARALLEAVCMQTREVLDAMRADSGTTLKSLKVDGGMSASDLVMQIQADVLGIPVIRPAQLETTSLGAAIVAGIAVGVWPNLQSAVNAFGIYYPNY